MTAYSNVAAPRLLMSQLACVLLYRLINVLGSVLSRTDLSITTGLSPESKSACKLLLNVSEVTNKPMGAGSFSM